MTSLVPEFLVTDLQVSLRFWIDLLDFEIHYERPNESFAYLRRESLDVMLEGLGQGRKWITADLQKPFGRGINFQMQASDWSKQLAKLRKNSWPLFMEPETKWYRKGDIETGQSQFILQDPDGYLLRLVQFIGERKL
jgi:catechol 2,3-dioxygenase-like lactoylglutathione lyase family enzyme